MNNNRNKIILFAAFFTIAACAPIVLRAVARVGRNGQEHAQTFRDTEDAAPDALREGGEQNAVPANVLDILAKAKVAADEDYKLNLCGFYTGMSSADAQTLVGYYALKNGECSTEGDPVYKIHLSLNGVRRVTKGGDYFDELAQAVGNHIGKLKYDYSLKTIDGIAVSMSRSSGFTMVDAEVKAAAERKARDDELKRARGELLSSSSFKAVAEAFLAGMVQIPGKDYKMGKTEVTQTQWEEVMGDNPSKFKSSNNPVENVSWDDCQDFLFLLNSIPAVKESGLLFRLPTEAEWEYACRAGATGDYCRLADGTEITEDTLSRVAWFGDNSNKTTHSVGQKKPNAFGLYDMHGNVSEWTSTVYGEARYGECRVYRGGSWDSPAGTCEASNRDRHSPDYRCNYLGFRLCASQNHP